MALAAVSCTVGVQGKTGGTTDPEEEELELHFLNQRLDPHRA